MPRAVLPAVSSGSLPAPLWLFRWLCLGLLAVSAALVASPDRPARPLTGKPWEDMDYGPFLTASIEAPAPRTNLAYKGLAIPVGRAAGGGRTEAVLFDTDLLRYAAGWTGGFVALKGVVFDGEHWAYPHLAGRQVFGNPTQPGWAKAGGFADPREHPFGPLPRDWAKWRGLYLHGEQVVLSYTVGDTAVLELPGVETRGEISAFSRVFNRGPAGEVQDLQVAFEAGWTGRVLSREQLEPAREVVAATGSLAVLEPPAGSPPPTEVLAAAVVGAPSDTRWLSAAEGHLRLSLPAGEVSSRFTVLLWRGPRAALAGFAALARQLPAPPDLTPLTRGGPARWAGKLTTQGRPGREDGPYAIDTLTAPDDNPWHSWLRFGGLDFFADGRRLALCTWSGDVWVVDGVDGDLAQLTWQRIATGLFQPLGLKIVREQIYVLGRDQITRLHDLNGDGEADWYENFNNDCLVSEHFHEFAADLKIDRDGNFYYIKCARHALPASHPHHGTLLKLPPDGSRLEVVARGFRAVNGLGVGPNGELTCVDNQGHWMPGNRINWIQPGGWYGNQWAWNPDQRVTYDEPLCWMHNFVDRSGGSHVWVPDDRWGPLRGQIVTVSYGMGHMFLLLHETVDGWRQGGVTRFPLEFETGVMRGVFHPGNGQLYVAGLYGWAGNKTLPGGVYRVRHTGRPLHLANSWRVARDGVVIGFTDPLDPAAATDPGNYDVTVWNYVWTANYGSPDLKPGGGEGRERLVIEAATLSAGRRTVFLKLRGLQPVMQMHVAFKLRGADGTAFENFIHGTVHRLGQQTGSDLLGAGTLSRAGGNEPALSQLAPGLAQTVEPLDPTPGREATPADTRRARLPALFVPAGSPPTPFVQPGCFRSTWTGYLNLELNDERAFQFEGRGAARLRLNGETVLDHAGPALEGEASRPVRLQGGPNRFELVYESPADGDAELRVLWSGRGLPPEPIPATAFVHEAGQPALEAGEAVRAGRNLFLQRQCVKCHRPDADLPAAANPELAMDAPALDGIGARLNAAWLAAYLTNPAAARDDVLMPQVLRGPPAEVERQARDIAAFLAKLRQSSETGAGGGRRDSISGEPETATAEDSATSDPATVAAGKAHFDRLGCGACHVLAGETRLSDDARLSLAHVPAKWRTGALTRFLARPAQNHAWTRMPDFKLSEAEVVALAAYLRSQAGAAAASNADTPPGEAARGRDLLASSGCLNCHAVPGLATQLQAPSLAPLAASDWRRGCVADDVSARGAAPEFGFDEAQLAALRAFAATDWRPALLRETPAEFAERHFANLRCQACHARDGQPDFWSRLTAARTPPVSGGDEEEGGAGSVHLGRPDLTYAGEKLHGEWMQRLLSGRLAYKPRPESQGRMPAFPAVGERLASGLAHQHGFPGAQVARPSPEPALAAVGAALTKVEGGFSCVACHGVGRQAALAGPDTATINFAFVADRLRPAYFWRYIRDPQRFRPGTMMPSFIAEDGSTPIKAVLDGDARRQFEAIWQYLLSLTPEKAAEASGRE
jgi:mono/diheme cytochrome c family protein